MPSQVSEHRLATSIGSSTTSIYISLFFFLLIVGLMVFFVIRYRRRSAGQEAQPSPSHNTPAGGPLDRRADHPGGHDVLLRLPGLHGHDAGRPLNAYEIQVTGQKWKWQFTYPNGYVDEDLHVPVDRPVQLTLTSTDVIHSLFVPALRIKRDVVPGRYTKIWFKPPRRRATTSCCAPSTAARATRNGGPADRAPAGRVRAVAGQGEQLPGDACRRPRRASGSTSCAAASSATRSTARRGSGRRSRTCSATRRCCAAAQQVLADENYIRESILEPQAKIVAGFDPVMPQGPAEGRGDQCPDRLSQDAERRRRDGAGQRGRPPATAAATQPATPAPVAPRAARQGQWRIRVVIARTHWTPRINCDAVQTNRLSESRLSPWLNVPMDLPAAAVRASNMPPTTT